MDNTWNPIGDLVKALYWVLGIAAGIILVLIGVIVWLLMK